MRRSPQLSAAAPTFRSSSCTARTYTTTSLARSDKHFHGGPSRSWTRLRTFGGAAAIASIGLGLVSLSRPAALCDPAPGTLPTPSPPAQAAGANTHPGITDPYELPPPPQSSVNLLELSFGTACGICAGVFVKKGARALAFVLGGIFVVLQYFASINIIRVNWSGAQSRFEKTFYTTSTSTGERRAPTVYSLWKWLVDFLTADFPPRASFLAGMALGLRIG